MKRTIAVVLSLACAWLPASGYAQPSIAPVAISGGQAPGLADGVVFLSNFADLQINDQAEVLFTNLIGGPGVDIEERRTIWIGAPGSLELAARAGDEAPGAGADVEFDFFTKPILTESGDAAFYALLRGPGISEDTINPGNDDSMWLVSRGAGGASSSEKNRFVDASPRLDRQFLPLFVPFFLFGPAAYCTFVKLMIFLAVAANEGDTFGVLLAFIEKKEDAVGGELRLDALAAAARDSAAANGSGSGFGFAELRPDQPPTDIAFPGMDAPGTGEAFSLLYSESIVASGPRIAFAAAVDAGDGIWSGLSGALEAAAPPRTPLPAGLAAELGPGATFGNRVSRFVGLNAIGELAFLAEVQAPGEPDTDALIVGPTGGLSTVVRTLPSGSSDDGFIFIDRIVLNAAGDVAFTGGHTDLGGVPGLMNGAWMTHDGGPPVLMLAEGFPAPGLAGDEVVSFLEEGPYMNRAGQVVMRTGVGTAAGFENTTHQAIWLIDAESGPQLVARGGGMMDVGGGQMRMLEIVSFISSHDVTLSGGEDGRPSPLNDAGELVFRADWQEPAGGFGAGVFVAASECAADNCRDVDRICKACGKPVGAGDLPTPSDALVVLRTSVGLAECATCVCDVDASGSVLPTDALITLRRSAGQPVDLACVSI